MLCKTCGTQFKGQCERCLRQRHQVFEKPKQAIPVTLSLPFSLFTYQEIVAKQVLSDLSTHSVNVHAVCGSGKTEMMIPIIQHVLANGGRVGWATPRIALVHEIRNRLISYTVQGDIGCCTGDFVAEDSSAIVVYTTHQAYRFFQHFDLVIVDEPDAFPYFSNEILAHAVQQSSKGKLVYLSATAIGDPNGTVVRCDQRPKGRVPIPMIRTGIWHLWTVLKTMHAWREKRVLIFVPSIRVGKILSTCLRCSFVSSQTEDLQSILDAFRSHGGWLVTTTILERGVTFENVYVLVLFADHQVFTKEVLVQIAGRVMRGTLSIEGECLMWARLRSGGIDACHAYHNQFASTV